MTTEVLGSAAKTAQAWIPDDSTFGARLALIRQRMAWGNVKEAAVACGIPVQSWRTWERDGVEPRGLQRIATQIAAATGCDLVWLMGGSALRGATQKSTDRKTPRAERMIPAPRRPADNRPVGQPSAGSPSSPRRTARVPRPTRP